MEELILKIKNEMDSFVKEADLQLDKGNKAAGARARKSSLEITKLMKEFRSQSLTYTKQ